MDPVPSHRQDDGDGLSEPVWARTLPSLAFCAADPDRRFGAPTDRLQKITARVGAGVDTDRAARSDAPDGACHAGIGVRLGAIAARIVAAGRDVDFNAGAQTRLECHECAAGTGGRVCRVVQAAAGSPSSAARHTVRKADKQRPPGSTAGGLGFTGTPRRLTRCPHKPELIPGQGPNRLGVAENRPEYEIIGSSPKLPAKMTG